MDLKLAAFSQKFEFFCAWSTVCVALMHTKCLFKTVLGNDNLTEAGATLSESPQLISRQPTLTKIRSEQCFPAVEKQSKRCVVPPGFGA